MLVVVMLSTQTHTHTQTDRDINPMKKQPAVMQAKSASQASEKKPRHH